MAKHRYSWREGLADGAQVAARALAFWFATGGVILGLYLIFRGAA